MNRRSFFRNLVGSFSVLVAAYATPISRFYKRDNWDGVIFQKDPFPRRFNCCPWTVLVKRGALPNAMGDTIGTVTYERLKNERGEFVHQKTVEYV